MHIITRKRLNDFAVTHPDVKVALQHWYKLMKANEFSFFVDLKTIFPSTDRVGNLTVFNIGGKKARLIAAIHYNQRKVYIRVVLTHEKYNRSKWKE